MDGIVVGIAQISFHTNLSEVTMENSALDYNTESSVVTSFSGTSLEATSDSSQVNDNSNNLCQENFMSENAWEEVEDDLENNIRIEKGHTLLERRQLPPRASKQSILGIKRRTIMKPVKRPKTHVDFQNLRYSDIRKIYLNKKVTNFKPSSLETIFEEATTFHNEQDASRLMGGRKIRRSLSFSDGFKYSKTLINKRRAKIKKTFGKRFALKKISLEEFITKLNSSIIQNEEDEGCEDQLESEIVISNMSASLDNEMASKISDKVV